MSLKKQYLKTKPICKVTFRLPKDEVAGARAAYVVGEFNGWDETSNKMKYLKSGEFTLTLDLEKNKEYQFRYLIDGQQWKNDSEADKYIRTEYGNCDNSVVVL